MDRLTIKPTGEILHFSNPVPQNMRLTSQPLIGTSGFVPGASIVSERYGITSQKMFLLIMCSDDTLVSKEYKVPGCKYYIISQERITDSQKKIILEDYKKYILTAHDIGDRTTSYQVQTITGALTTVRINEPIYLAGVKFDIDIIVTNILNESDPKMMRDILLKNERMYSTYPKINSNSRYNYGKEHDIKSLREASIYGIVEKDVNPNIPRLKVYYINEGESAEIYSKAKRELEKYNTKLIKEKEKKTKKGIGPFYEYSSVTFKIGQAIEEHCLVKYPIFKKYQSNFKYNKANLVSYLELAKDLGIKLKSEIFNSVLPYVQGTLESKNDYYPFITLAIKMKLIEKPKKV